MEPGRNVFSDGVTEHEFRYGLAVKRDDDLALLGIVGGIAVDGEGGGHAKSVGAASEGAQARREVSKAGNS